MIPVQELKIFDPGRGGAVEKVASHSINDNESAPPDTSTLPLLNCHTDTIGSIVKRSGYTLYAGQLDDAGSPATTMEEITGLFQYLKFDGTEYEIACASSGGTEKIFDISTPASPSDITDSLTITDDTLFDFCVVADTLIMTTQARDTPIKWTGSGNAAALGGTPPSGKYCEEFFNYAFIANTTANPERLFWSALFDPETWTVGTDFKRMEDAITGMIRRGSEMFVFTKNSITTVQFTGDSVNPFRFEQLDTRIGCISHYSIKNIDGTIYWHGGDGHIYRMEGYIPERVTEGIPQTLALTNLGGSQNQSMGIDHRELRQYWLSVPKDTSNNDFVIAVDYINNSIFFYDGMTINYIANFSDSSGNVKTYFGDRTGRVYLTNNGNSDNPAETSTAIDFFRYTKAFNLNSPNRVKRVRRVKATVNDAGNFDTQIDIIGDFGNTGGQTLELNHDGGGKKLGQTWTLGVDALGRKTDLTRRNDVSTTSKYIQLKLYNDAVDQPVKIRDLSIEFQQYLRF